MLRTILYVHLFCTIIAAQIPNPGFEEWIGSEPSGWQTINSPGFFTPIEKTTDRHSGNAALKGTVTSFASLPVLPIISTFFKMDDRPAALTGYYKFQTAGNDVFMGVMYFYNQQNFIGYAELSFTTTSVYTPFSFDIEYFDESIPDTAFCEFFITDTSDGTPNIGSVFYLDDLAFSGVTSLPEQDNIIIHAPLLARNYPNPFNPQTRITFNLDDLSAITINIFDNSGKQVENLALNQTMSKGTHEIIWDASNYPSGVYFYRISDGRSIVSGKMTLLK